MRDYIIRRIVLAIPTVFLVTIIVFLTIRLIPGDVIQLMVLESGAEGAGSGEQLAAAMEELRHKLGLTLDKAEQTRILRELNLYCIDQYHVIAFPASYTYIFWQPWIKGYSGEPTAGKYNRQGYIQYI